MPKAQAEHSTVTLTLTGLDGANPLAFLAALGVLRVLDHRARHYQRPLPKLSWVDDGAWRPVIHGCTNIDTLIGELLEDIRSWADEPALLLAYDETGERLVDPRKARGSIARDLKPRPAAMREFLETLASGAAKPLDASGRWKLRRALDTAAAYGSELIQDNKGNTKPTAFHFTAGQQQFLRAVAELQAHVTADDLREAVMGPWLRQSTLPNMGWDATNARLYALRASNPSNEKKTSVAGADWLAFVGLGTFPVFPVGDRLATTGIEGGWKDASFTWFVWEGPVTQRVASSIVRDCEVSELTRAARRARGVGAVFRARILRSDQGGYGSFAPADAQ